MKVYWPSKLNSKYLMFLGLVMVFLLGLPVFFLKPGAALPDNSVYLSLAQRMLIGKGVNFTPESYYSSVSYIRSPFFPILFAISFKLFGVSLSSALIVTKLAAFGSFFILFLLINRIFNIQTGLATISLVATSLFLVSFPASLNNDQTMALFMLLGVWLAVDALFKESNKLAFAAGIAFGLGVLVKELAIIWAPIPIYLFLSISTVRNTRNLVSLLIYAIGFILPTISWVLYYYLMIGEFYLISAIPDSLLSYLWVLPVGFSFSILIYSYLSRSQWLKNQERLPIVVSNFINRYAGFLVCLLWFVITYVFTVILANMSVFRFESLTEIPLRLSGFLVFFERRILPNHPLFNYLLLACGILIIDTIIKKRIDKGTQVLLWIFLACIPQILTIQITGAYEMAYRYLMHFYWISYAVLGRALIIILNLLSEIIHSGFQFYEEKGKISQILNSFVLLSIFIIGLFSSWKIGNEYEYIYPSPSNYNVPNVKLVSDWIKDNVPVGSKIASSENYLPMIDFYTGNAYDIQRWGVETSDKGKSSVIWPYQQLVVYKETNGELRLIGSAGEYVEIEKPLYLQYHLTRIYPGDTEEPGGAVAEFFTVDRYATISEEPLINFLQEFEIDYLILSTADYYRTLHAIPDYFKDSPAFKEVFATNWTEGVNNFGIYVFAVDRTRLNLTEYPTILNSKEWYGFLNHAQSLLKDEYNLSRVIESLGGGPVVFRPASADNYILYDQLAQAYMASGNFDLAAFEYHLALLESPAITDNLLEKTSQFSVLHPEAAGVWLLLGDIYYQQGFQDQAEEAYRRAIAAPIGSNHSVGAAYQAMGKISLAKGDDTTAKEYLTAALEKTVFGGEITQKGLLLVEANEQLNQGNLDHAIALFTDYFSGSSLPLVESGDSTNLVVYFDFLKQFAQTSSNDNSNNRPAVFFIDGKVVPTLFAHPNSKISFSLDLPANVVLKFAPVIDTAVWQYGKGDGVHFKIELSTRTGSHFVIYDEYLDPKNLIGQRNLLTKSIDLSQWAGQNVTITFSTGCGPNDDCRFDWAGWGEPHISQPVAYNFIDHFNEASSESMGNTEGLTEIITQTINYDTRTILFQHPSSRITYSVDLPPQASIQFGVGASQEVWTAEKSDGVEYNIYVRSLEEPSKLHRVYHRIIDPKNHAEDRRWFDERLDLSQFGGNEVEIIFEALPGPNDNFDFDWGGWSSPVLLDDTITD